MKKLLEISHLKKSFGDTEVLKDNVKKFCPARIKSGF